MTDTENRRELVKWAKDQVALIPLALGGETFRLGCIKLIAAVEQLEGERDAQDKALEAAGRKLITLCPVCDAAMFVYRKGVDGQRCKETCGHCGGRGTVPNGEPGRIVEGLPSQPAATPKAELDQLREANAKMREALERVRGYIVDCKRGVRNSGLEAYDLFLVDAALKPVDTGGETDTCPRCGRANTICEPDGAGGRYVYCASCGSGEANAAKGGES